MDIHDWLRRTYTTALREWVENSNRPPYADSLGADGNIDFVWRFRDDCVGQPERSGSLQYRRGTRHPDGKSSYGRSWQPRAFLEELARLGIPLDMPVRASYSMW